MDIRDSIRKAIREDINAKRYIKWDSDSQPNLYALDNFLRKSGYRLIDFVEHKEGPSELIVEPIKSDYLHPEIFHDVKENEFYAKVVDHGMLVASDLEEIVKGYNTALGVLNHLNSLDLSKLETVIEEE